MKSMLTVMSRVAITLRAKLRQALRIKAGDQLVAENAQLPTELYSADRVREFNDAEAQLEQVLPRKRNSQWWRASIGR